MSPERRQSAWWGWGAAEAPRAVPEPALALLRAELGLGARRRPPVALEEVRLGEPHLSASARDALVRAAGEDAIRGDRATRVLHAAGKSYPDLVRQRAGDAARAPDLVVSPGDRAAVARVLDACAGARVAVVPFGGGTSVVGGLEPLRGECAGVLALDLGRLDDLVALDERSLTATFGAGTRLPEADDALARRGLTLGHVPQSYHYATIGGCVATRSAGQSSTGYGRIDELVLGLRVAAPTGEIILPALPASAAGPGLRQLLVGSEGTLGVITEVALRVRPRPATGRYEGWFLRSFAEGVEALRALEQEHAAPDVARLSDEDETRLSLILAAGGGLAAWTGRTYLRARRALGGCLVIVGWEGSEREVARRRTRGATLLRRHGGLALGRRPGAAWARERFAGPYLRDGLLDHGVMAETLETATQWSALGDVHAAVGQALHEVLSGRGTPPLVLCHVSHLYASGASLYFTVLARQEEGAEIDQWRAAKRAATEAILAAGGTISHHHAVGRDHAEWMAREVGETGLTALRAVKDRLDPVGIMNPEKLLPPEGLSPS